MINYIKVFEDGSTEATVNKPSYGVVSITSDYFLNGKWYDSTTNLPYIEQFTYLSQNGKLLGVEVNDGQPTAIHLEDTESNEVAPFISVPSIQADTIVSKEYQGKNACTAWVNFDGTATPPIIKDSFNVSAVIRTSTGRFDIYFNEDMDNADYSAVTSTKYYGISQINSYYVNKVEVITSQASTFTNIGTTTLQIFGGKN